MSGENWLTFPRGGGRNRERLTKHGSEYFARKVAKTTPKLNSTSAQEPTQLGSKSGLRLSFLSFSALLPMKQLFCCQLSLPQNHVHSFIQMSSSLLKCLNLMVASVEKNPTMIRLTLSCGRALCERALWLLLLNSGNCNCRHCWNSLREMLLCVHSPCLNCETETFPFADFSANFSRFFANVCQF